MSEEFVGITEEIVKQSSGVLEKVYDDLAHPSAEAMGQMISYAPRTLRLCLSKWEKWLVNGEESLRKTEEALKDKVEKIPEDRYCVPEPYIAIPAIQQIAYCFDSAELREMYANLLAMSMDTAMKDEVHPSYVEIIKQLTPDEAKLLSVLSRAVEEGAPVVDVIIDDGNWQYTPVLRYFSLIGEDVCDRPEMIPAYLENLCRLKLIEIPEEVTIVGENIYEPLFESPRLEMLRVAAQIPDDKSFDFKRRALFVTNFGLGFIKCCIDDYDPEIM